MSLIARKCAPIFSSSFAEPDVVLQRILRALGIEDVAGVAERAFADGVRFLHGLHRGLHVREIVERIEDAEDIHAALGGVLHETGDDVRRIARVADGIRAAQEHLETDVRHALAQRAAAAATGLR